MALRRLVADDLLERCLQAVLLLLLQELCGQERRRFVSYSIIWLHERGYAWKQCWLA